MHPKSSKRMKTFLSDALIGIFLCLASPSLAQNTQDNLIYTDATNYRVINRGYRSTQPALTRIPDALKGQTRPEIFELAQCSAGIGIRFRTNSKTIAARYLLKEDEVMNHMPFTGIKGSDLYLLTEADNQWHYIATIRPQQGKQQQRKYTSRMDGEMHEYLIYLPLYDGVDKFEIGVDSAAIIEYPKVDNPRHGGKIVFFGTSIMQGGCASRTGVTQTNQLQRLLNRECVNMGFSGSAKLYPENVRTILSMDEDIAMYVIDPLMNNPLALTDSLAYTFMKMLADSITDKPILMVPCEIQPNQEFDTRLREDNPKRNAIWKQTYLRLRKEGHKNLYYMNECDFAGKDGEGTVDNTHLTDAGFNNYVKAILPYLKRIIKKTK